MSSVYDISTVRKSVAEFFSETAGCRESMARRFDKPWNQKNTNYAESLEIMANYIEGLPDDDPTLRLLASCRELFFYDGAEFWQPQDENGQSETHDAAIHIGVPWKVSDPEECVDEFKSWAETAMSEATKLKHFYEEGRLTRVES